MKYRFVENPAMEAEFLAFAEQIQLKLSEEKMVVSGAALIPNKKIYRIDDKGNEYFVVFSEETISKIVQRYFTQNKQINFNLEHNKDNGVKGVIIESWIVEDTEMDKSVAMGFKNVSKGTWMISVKLTDQLFWNEYIKKGKVSGFSVEGMFAQDLVEALSKPSLEDLKGYNLTSEEAEYLIKSVLMK